MLGHATVASAGAAVTAPSNGTAKSFSLAAPTPFTSANSVSVPGRLRTTSIGVRSGNTI